MNIRDLLEKDKERLMTRLANAVSPEQAARECEDELGRLLLEYNEQAPSDRVSEAAYYSMQTYLRSHRRCLPRSALSVSSQVLPEPLSRE